MTVQPTAREMRRPDFPSVVLSYTDVLQVLDTEGAALNAAQLAEATERVTSNVKRDLHKLADAQVVAFVKGTDEVVLTDKGRDWLTGMAVARREIDVSETRAAPGDVVVLQHHQLRRNPDQPRRRFSEAELEALTVSVAEKGVLQNLLVRPAAPLPFDDDAFPGEAHVIIAGERRWRAVGRLIAAGEWPEGQGLTCRIATPEDEAEELETAIVENLQRADLDHMEMGLGFERLAQSGRTNQEIARSVGRTPEFVQQHRRLTKLDARDQQLVAEGRLSLHDALKVVRGHCSVIVHESGMVMLAPARPAAPEPEQPRLDVETEQPAQGPYDPRLDADAPQPASEPLQQAFADQEAEQRLPSPRERLAMVELAHKTAAHPRAADGGACEVGQYWLDRTATNLEKAGWVLFFQSHIGPIARLTTAGLAMLDQLGVAVPVTLMTLFGEQEAVPGDWKGLGRTYATDWIEYPVPADDAQAELTGQLVGKPDPATSGIVTVAPQRPPATGPADDWDRSPEQIAADRQLLDDARAFVDAGPFYEPTAFRILLGRAGIDLARGPLTVAPEGAIVACRALEGAEHQDFGEAFEIATVDVAREIPTERADAVAALFTFAVNTVADLGKGAS